MDSVPHIATGCPVFDIDHGSDYACPGLPQGRVMLLEGEETTGKTTLALLASAAVIRAGSPVVYIDLLNGLAPDFVESFGIPLDSYSWFAYYTPETRMDAIKVARACAGTAGLIVIDGLYAGIQHMTADQLCELHYLWAHHLPELKAALGTTTLPGTTTLLGLSWPDAIGVAWKFATARRVFLERLEHPEIRFTVTKDILDSFEHPTTGTFTLPVPDRRTD